MCTCLKKPHTLFERSPDIRRVGVAHCLDNYWISSSDDDITDPHRVTCIFYHNSGLKIFILHQNTLAGLPANLLPGLSYSLAQLKMQSHRDYHIHLVGITIVVLAVIVCFE